jgi:hypothetical protein
MSWKMMITSSWSNRLSSDVHEAFLAALAIVTLRFYHARAAHLWGRLKSCPRSQEQAGRWPPGSSDSICRTSDYVYIYILIINISNLSHIYIYIKFITRTYIYILYICVYICICSEMCCVKDVYLKNIYRLNIYNYTHSRFTPIHVPLTLLGWWKGREAASTNFLPLWVYKR